MKLVSYLKEERDQLAILENDLLYDTDLLHTEMPSSMGMFLTYWEDSYSLALKLRRAIIDKRIGREKGYPFNDAHLLAPVPFPASCRNSFAFKNYKNAWRNKMNLPLLNEFNKQPLIVFSNPHCIQGGGDVMCMPDHFNKLDFELQIAAVVGKLGRNIPADEANEYIAGLMIMNNFSARTLQMEEIDFGIVSSKGKDFATATGPWLISIDELEEFEIPTKENHIGKSWSLNFNCFVNGELISDGNTGDMQWTFAELIEHASYGATLYPGDIISSGPVNNGCLFEVNTINNERWLKEGDVIEMEVEGLGKLINTIVKEESEFSILNKKKY